MGTNFEQLREIYNGASLDWMPGRNVGSIDRYVNPDEEPPEFIPEPMDIPKLTARQRVETSRENYWHREDVLQLLDQQREELT